MKPDRAEPAPLRLSVLLLPIWYVVALCFFAFGHFQHDDTLLLWGIAFLLLALNERVNEREGY